VQRINRCTPKLEINQSFDGQNQKTFCPSYIAKAAILFDLAKMGDIMGILEGLEELEKEDQEISVFTSKIRLLAKNFEEGKICQILEQYMFKKLNYHACVLPIRSDGTKKNSYLSHNQ
jgi:hypothetical protein